MPSGEKFFANIPLVSFLLLSEYINSAPLTCAPRIGNSIDTSDWRMSFDTCESKSSTHSVPFHSRGIAVGVFLLKLYLLFVVSANLLSH